MAKIIRRSGPKFMFLKYSGGLITPALETALFRKAYTFSRKAKRYYPNFETWFFETEVPRIQSRKGSLIIAFEIVTAKRLGFLAEGEKFPEISPSEFELLTHKHYRFVVVGLLLTKNDDDERKICHLSVFKKYQKHGIATKMIQMALDSLGTNYPLITMDMKISFQFEHIIRKFGWKHTQTTNPGYYQRNHREVAFNGYLPERSRY